MPSLKNCKKVVLSQYRLLTRLAETTNHVHSLSEEQQISQNIWIIFRCNGLFREQ